ncbi:hypothetical protein [Nostoc sp. FACHB-888]|uniref:hypothetical protein n=1 Tax=Nostoc sp. FACHB-888 TaxID=2692842 RepID=UPI001685C358|nr:hypothetical protein [Nostoc sp. FACHB-888]MBD2248725.1 hypothetical protein [Nostoc sp. FACHB-888]
MSAEFLGFADIAISFLKYSSKHSPASLPTLIARLNDCQKFLLGNTASVTVGLHWQTQAHPSMPHRAVTLTPAIALRHFKVGFLNNYGTLLTG